MSISCEVGVQIIIISDNGVVLILVIMSMSYFEVQLAMLAPTHAQYVNLG